MIPQQGLQADPGERPDVMPSGRHRAPRRRWWVLIAAVLVLALGAAALVGVDGDDARVSGPSAAPTDSPAVTGTDALERRVLTELGVFTQWLEANDAEGYIGEIGIPVDGDERWNRLAERWFEAAEDAGMWVDVWSVGEWWGRDYIYSPFAASRDNGPIDVTRPSGDLLVEQARRSDLPRGVNLSGGEFGSAGGTEAVTDFSNENPGTYDRDYTYDSQATFEYLAAQGLDTVRLPFRWERIQPRLGEELDPAELARLRDAVQRASAAGLQVILDVHNFGAYHLEENGRGVRRAIGTAEVSRAHFADLWRRLSDAFADDSGVVAYDLMNEPVNLPKVDGMTPARLWEAASQDAVNAIRANDDATLIMVPGYQWSHVYSWTDQHDDAWIDDPADNIRYTAHHYWQLDYDRSYDAEVAAAAARGY